MTQTDFDKAQDNLYLVNHRITEALRFVPGVTTGRRLEFVDKLRDEVMVVGPIMDSVPSNRQQELHVPRLTISAVDHFYRSHKTQKPVVVNSISREDDMVPSHSLFRPRCSTPPLSSRPTLDNTWWLGLHNPFDFNNRTDTANITPATGETGRPIRARRPTVAATQSTVKRGRDSPATPQKRQTKRVKTVLEEEDTIQPDPDQPDRCCACILKNKTCVYPGSQRSDGTVNKTCGNCAEKKSGCRRPGDSRPALKGKGGVNPLPKAGLRGSTTTSKIEGSTSTLTVVIPAMTSKSLAKKTGETSRSNTRTKPKRKRSLPRMTTKNNPIILGDESHSVIDISSSDEGKTDNNGHKEGEDSIPPEESAKTDLSVVVDQEPALVLKAAGLRIAPHSTVEKELGPDNAPIPLLWSQALYQGRYGDVLRNLPNLAATPPPPPPPPVPVPVPVAVPASPATVALTTSGADIYCLRADLSKLTELVEDLRGNATTVSSTTSLPSSTISNLSGQIVNITTAIQQVQQETRGRLDMFAARLEEIFHRLPPPPLHDLVDAYTSTDPFPDPALVHASTSTDPMPEAALFSRAMVDVGVTTVDDLVDVAPPSHSHENGVHLPIVNFAPLIGLVIDDIEMELLD